MRNGIWKSVRRLRFAFPPKATVVALLALSAAWVQGQTVFTLKNTFIEQYKNRATITATYTIDKAHAHPNPASKDGDLHVAGRSPGIGLPTVAELMNAKERSDAMDVIHEAEGTGKAISMTGAWRLWTEHGGQIVQTQGESLDAFTTTNPAHVFEIHPITQVDDLNVLSTLHPIAGFVTKDADSAFDRYERTSCRIDPDTDTTTLTVPMAGYNYVEFIMQLSDDQPLIVEDGRFVYAAVLTLDDELIVQKRRIVFVKGSEPEKAVKTLHAGDELHVVGIPRIDLALVDWRVKHANDQKWRAKDILSWSLPYEIIVVGVYTKEPN